MYIGNIRDFTITVCSVDLTTGLLSDCSTAVEGVEYPEAIAGLRA
jgi:hypothetical protein